MKNESIVVEHTFAVPIEKVWNAITDPRQMRQWYFPMMEDFQAEKGFETRFDLIAGDKHFLHIWKVTDVIPGQKISYEWRYDGYPGNSLLTLALFENKEGTRLVLTHDRLETFQGDKNPGLAKDNFLQGWKGFIDTRLKNYLDKISGPSGETGMLIRKHVNEVFEAFIDPDITTKFWFTHSTGRLEQAKEVTWSWEMYNHHSRVVVKEIIPNQRISIEWGAAGEKRTCAEWTFESLESDSTFVSIEMWGFTGDQESILHQVSGSVGGSAGCWQD